MSKFLCGGKTDKKTNMYSDSSSSTTGSESEENYPGYIPVPMSEFDDMLPGDKTKLYQAYKGQLKLSAYINYGLLTVHVVLGRHIKSKFKPNCDSYVKLSLVPDDTRRTRCKTEVIHDTNNPLFDEKFSFELLDEDSPKRLLLSVWNRDTQRNQCEFLGCMSFGVHSIMTKQKSIHGWYYLLSGDLGRKKHLQVTDKRHLSERTSKNIPQVNQDILWMEPCVMIIKRGKSGFGFTINGSCPVTVCRVDGGSSADTAGVKTGDCIVRIDGLNVSRSTCDSVARIIRHSQKKLVLEVQRPKKVETTFKLESLDRSPRQPLSSSTPSNNHMEDLIMSPWKPPSRRQLETVMEERSPPMSPGSPGSAGYETQDYGWIDNGRRHIDEDIYVEPDELRHEVLQLPRDPSQPPALPPPNRPGKKIEDMVVSPWKPPVHPDDHYDEDDTYMCLDKYRRYREEDVISDSRYEWDYSDTRLDDYHDDTPEWNEQRWAQKPSSGQGSSSGYSSSTLPRSMKFGKKKSSSRMDSGYPPNKGYHDDMSYRSNKGLGAHGDHGNRAPQREMEPTNNRTQFSDYGYIDRPVHRSDERLHKGPSYRGDERSRYVLGSSRQGDERTRHISRHGDERTQYIDSGHYSDEHVQYRDDRIQYSDDRTQYSDDRTQYSTGSGSLYSGSSSSTLHRKQKRVSFNVNRHSAV